MVELGQIVPECPVASPKLPMKSLRSPSYKLTRIPCAALGGEELEGAIAPSWRTQAGAAAMTAIVPTRFQPITQVQRSTVPALVAAAREHSKRRFLELFAANIRNPRKRRAYDRAVAGFLTWCDDQGASSIAEVQSLHVASWIERQTREHAAPTAKARLAALRHLFDWLVTGRVVPVNPAGSALGPSDAVTTSARQVPASGRAPTPLSLMFASCSPSRFDPTVGGCRRPRSYPSMPCVCGI